jgi:hypothetical protein
MRAGRFGTLDQGAYSIAELPTATGLENDIHDASPPRASDKSLYQSTIFTKRCHMHFDDGCRRDACALFPQWPQQS